MFAKPAALFLKRRAAVAAAMAAALLALAAGAGPADPVRIFTLKPGVSPEALSDELGLKRAGVFHHAFNGFAARLSDAKVAALRRDKRIVAIENDGPIFTAMLGCASRESLPPTTVIPAGVARLGLTNFPEYYFSNQSNRIQAVIAILDTGINNDSGLLNLKVETNFSDEAEAPGSNYFGADDFFGHGTMVSGVAASGNYGYGFPGVAPGAALWDVRVLDSSGSGDWTNFLNAMEFIAQNAGQIEVANASLEGNPDADGPVTAVEQSVSNVVAHGVVFVAAAGNDSQDVYGADQIFGTADDHLPAAVPESMTVSAMDPSDDDFAGFSNCSHDVVTNADVISPGKAIDLCAPGVNIISTYPGDMGCENSGTSFAAPHVAGLVALYIAANGRATNAAGVYHIRQTLVDNGLPQSQWRSAPNTGDPDGNPEPLAMPSENWIPPVTITGAAIAAEGFQFSFNCEPGYTQTVQCAGALAASATWTNLASFTDNAGIFFQQTFTDTNAPAAARFYRVLRQPSTQVITYNADNN